MSFKVPCQRCHSFGGEREEAAVIWKDFFQGCRGIIWYRGVSGWLQHLGHPWCRQTQVSRTLIKVIVRDKLNSKRVDDSNIKMARKPWKNQKGNPLECTRKCKRWKEIIKPKSECNYNFLIDLEPNGIWSSE